jgi:uncharacterized membrane protein YdjX (TVP38/TMEM64 family)
MAEAKAGGGLSLRTKLIAAAVVLIAAALLVYRGLDVHALVDRGVSVLRSAGPWGFFAAMAVLPAVGVPLLTFALTAGPAFSAQMGTGGVLAAGLGAITFNLTLTYWIATRELRPFLVRLVERLGHRVPRVEPEDMTDLIVFVRVMPGIPFPIQNYLLGLAAAPPLRYFAISCVAAWVYNTGFILFGDALLSGKGGRIAFSASLIVAVAAATHFVRRHLAARARRRATEAPAP